MYCSHSAVRQSPSSVNCEINDSQVAATTVKCHFSRLHTPGMNQLATNSKQRNPNYVNADQLQKTIVTQTISCGVRLNLCGKVTLKGSACMYIQSLVRNRTTSSLVLLLSQISMLILETHFSAGNEIPRTRSGLEPAIQGTSGSYYRCLQPAQCLAHDLRPCSTLT